ncbi:SH3 domain-containing YSC84-like protein 1 isoform X2 [Micropterus salmoides]|uniref:SH3 domain-containing YSC84-like protein 1 isoform X2 n=2 Tax=Micropterus TaxID=27705 RepID=UPI0018ED83FA|nr:SH3 domain-containing YSC84-like protein 1 isoform X2 [Micropterus salmoides]
MSNPIPSNLKSEAKKAAKILRDFTEISNRNGPDKLIPPHVIAKAEGLAIISVIKAGFMITARGGSGIVIARLADRRWSAPSAIGIAGLGGGFEIGVEVSDLVIILNQRRAVDAFTKGGNLTLGGNCTVAVGPMGRNVEADVAIRSTAAVFTYCRSRGLFAGISLEGSGLIERKETNRKFYSQDIRASAILNGDVEPPPECYDLYHILEEYTEAYTTDWTNKNMRSKSVRPSRPPPPPLQKRASSFQQPASSFQQPASSSGRGNALYPSISVYKSETSGQYASRSSQNYANPPREGPSVGGASGQLVCTATHPFTGQQPGDLSFVPGDRITVITSTDSQYDWWEGQLDDGRVGIFPANFVTY